ncbi:21431_t:CDS:2 [Gigaspora margarita]|uniref:21431_t:CDS:1 n=1 Tax=Gigaspora margarita TaxID=4874 RepID=A0ABN7UH88_GIGMA|nr:21431_t:CDS:2 [Gigaspora margarita]
MFNTEDIIPHVFDVGGKVVIIPEKTGGKLDVNFKDLYEEISKLLKVKYLSRSPDEELKEVNGIMFGTKHRIFVSLPVRIK